MNEQIEPTTESANTGRKEFDRQHRVGQHALPPDEERTCDGGARQLERKGQRQSAKVVDADDQRAEGHRAQQGAEPIEMMPGERGSRVTHPRFWGPGGAMAVLSMSMQEFSRL